LRFRPIKGCGKYLKFVFMTGLSPLNRADMTGELNNLQNISMRGEYSALCGITEKVLLTELRPDIQRMADANNETYEEACAHLKKQYDGYHFSKNCEDIYNPFSLFNALNAKDYKSFWFSTGTATFLIELLQEADFNVCDLEGIEATDEEFDGTPEEALAQIESKNYAIPFQSDGRRIVKIGVNFDSATRTIGEWKIVE